MVMFGPVALAIPIGSVSVQAGARLTLATAAALTLAAAVSGFAAGRRLELPADEHLEQTAETSNAPGA